MAKKGEKDKGRKVRQEGKGDSREQRSTSEDNPPPSDTKSDKVGAAKQLLEFYFGDSNLRADRFLQQERKKSPEGWVSLDILKTFRKVWNPAPSQGTAFLRRCSSHASTSFGGGG